MKEYAEKEGFLSQPRTKLSKYFLENGTIFRPLLLFYLDLGLVCKKHRFVQYIPMKRFNNFLQYAVHAGRKEDENPNTSVVAKTMKSVANSYGYQILD